MQGNAVDLRAAGQRLLLVETSGVESFSLTRAFYAKRGYTQEARVRDYYERGNEHGALQQITVEVAQFRTSPAVPPSVAARFRHRPGKARGAAASSRCQFGVAIAMLRHSGTRRGPHREVVSTSETRQGRRRVRA